MDEKQQQTKLEQFGQRLKDIFIPGIKMNDQEETMLNIILKILNADSTEKLTPRTGIYYLVNKKCHYYVRVSRESISIINSVDSITRSCRVTFADFVQEQIEKSLEKDAAVMEQTLFMHEMAVLGKLENKVDHEH